MGGPVEPAHRERHRRDAHHQFRHSGVHHPVQVLQRLGAQQLAVAGTARRQVLGSRRRGRAGLGRRESHRPLDVRLRRRLRLLVHRATPQHVGKRAGRDVRAGRKRPQRSLDPLVALSRLNYHMGCYRDGWRGDVAGRHACVLHAAVVDHRAPPRRPVSDARAAALAEAGSRRWPDLLSSRRCS